MVDILGITPLSQIQREQDENGGLDRVRLYLPLSERVDSDVFGLRINLMRSLCRLAGIRLSVAGKWDRSASKTRVGTAGINSLNTAVASKSMAIDKVKDYSSSLEIGEDYIPMGSRIGEAKIDINMQAVADQIEDESRADFKVSPYSTERWTHFIGQAIAGGIYEEGTKNLTSNIQAYDRVKMFAANGISILSLGAYSTIVTEYNLGFSPAILMALTLIGSQYENFVNYTQTKGDERAEYRYSLFSGPQHDRALILKSILLTVPLAGEVAKIASKE